MLGSLSYFYWLMLSMQQRTYSESNRLNFLIRHRIPQRPQRPTIFFYVRNFAIRPTYTEIHQTQRFEGKIFTAIHYLNSRLLFVYCLFNLSLYLQCICFPNLSWTFKTAQGMDIRRSIQLSTAKIFFLSLSFLRYVG